MVEVERNYVVAMGMDCADRYGVQCCTNGVNEMTDHTISLAGDFTVNKGPRDKTWVATAVIDRAKLSADIVAQLIDHGLKQLIADAASQEIGRAHV